jgi:hypothetical protein
MEDIELPKVLHLEGGGVVLHAVGTRVYNYYDMKAGVIEKLATCPDPATMPVHHLDGDHAWWVGVRHDDGSYALLDQSRMCTEKTARFRGWLT